MLYSCTHMATVGFKGLIYKYPWNPAFMHTCSGVRWVRSGDAGHADNSDRVAQTQTTGHAAYTRLRDVTAT